MNELIKNLHLCMNEEEVWELMADQKLSPQYDAKVGDETIILPDSHAYDGAITLPDNDYGLAVKLVTYLTFNGYLGHANYGGGAQAYLGRFRTLWNDFNEIKKIICIAEITSELIEEWINRQLKKEYNPISIMRKLLRLEDWFKASSMLPYFLSFNIVLQECPSYSQLKKEHDRVSADNWKGDKTETIKYPLYLLFPILQNAITYVTAYTNDIDIIMKERNYFNEKGADLFHLNKRIHQFFKNTNYIFKESSLSLLQKHCLDSTQNTWSPMPTMPKYGARSIISEVVSRWQAANLIILGFFTAARSNEISRQERNIQTPKTKYHDIDQGYNFTRVVWKTSRFGQALSTPLPPLGLQAYRNLSRHSEQIDNKTIGRLIFPVWMRLENKTNADRMGQLLKYFSHWVNGDNKQHLTPHQLRHAMASILSHLNDKNGLMIAAKLLGHKSVTMTLTYQSHIKTMVLNQMNHMADTNEEIASAFRDFEYEESTRVLKEVVMPELNKKNPLVGPAKGIVQFTGSVVKDPESFFTFHSQAIKDGQLAFTQTPVCLCVRAKNNTDQMACQRGITAEDYRNIPVQSSACQGASCINSLFTEQNCKMLKHQTQSVKDLAPDDLKEIASDWFFVVGDGLEMPNKKVLDEYEEALKLNNRTG